MGRVADITHLAWRARRDENSILHEARRHDA
jgi:hypothetical protein